MSDIFAATGPWKEERFDISDTSGVFGMAVVLNGCQTQPYELELRLAHRFTNLKMKVGQANNSGTSDNTVVVDVVKNGTKIDSQSAPFDVVQPFDEDITDANSLKLQFHIDPAKCVSGTVTVVVEGLTVS